MKEDKGGEVDFGLNGEVVWAAFGAGVDSGNTFGWWNDCDGCFCDVVMSPCSYWAPILHTQLLCSSEGLPVYGVFRMCYDIGDEQLKCNHV